MINQGPSYTNEAKVVKFYFPNPGVISSVGMPKSDEVDCTEDDKESVTELSNPIPDDEDNPVSCVNGHCKIFTCTIPRNWKKNDGKEFNLEITFDGSKGEESATVYSIYSIVTIDGQQVEGAVHFKSDFIFCLIKLQFQMGLY